MSEVDKSTYPLLESINSPDDVKALSLEECRLLADEIRVFIVDAVTGGGTGHLGSNLGIVEVTLAMHRVFSSPRDVLLFDTGHQAYVHKLVTGRREGFARLRKEGGLSGYPNRAESEHDWIENSHASTALSYAHGLATAFKSTGEDATRRVVALVGDGALTGGMAYEALNNLGHANSRVCIILNDNGRSYAPTISRLSESLTQLRLNPSFSSLQAKVTKALEDLPGVGHLAGHSLRSVTAAVRELVEPHVFFEALGVRYTGPIDGHDIGAIEQALKRAAAWQGPIVLHVLTRKGRGYGPAEEDTVQCLHDYKAAGQLASPGTATDQGAISIGPRSPDKNYTEAFAQALLDVAAKDERVIAMTAAMPGPTGLLTFEARYPNRFLDVGIAESHAMTAAAGIALGGLKPVVAIYSTFLSRCFDQENLDVGLHGAPVVICADRAGITGDDGPSHHGILDMVLGLAIPDLAIFAPSEPAERPTFRQPKRTWVGAATSLAWTTTVSPSIVASAGTNLPSAPAISNSASGLPSRDFSPPPTWAKDSRILSALDLHRLVERPRVDEVLLAVVLGQRPEGQAVAHVELVLGVDVLDVVSPSRSSPPCRCRGS